MLTHANLRSNAEVLVETWRFTADDVLIHALPIFHTHGLFVATNVSLMAGATMILLPKFDPREVLALLPRATVLMGVPTFYTRLLDQPGLTREAAAGMRLFVSGSAPLLAETHRAFRERTGHAILERYGMTETSMNTSNPYDGDRVAGSVGFPLPGVEVRVTDPESGRAASGRRDRHDRDPRPERLCRLLADAGEDARRVSLRRLLHQRRSRAHRRARLSLDRRARQGHRDLRRLQRLSEGGGAGDRRAAGRRRRAPSSACRIAISARR